MGHAADKFVVVERHALVRIQQAKHLHGRRQELLGEGLVGQSIRFPLGRSFSFEFRELLLQIRHLIFETLHLVVLALLLVVLVRAVRAIPDCVVVGVAVIILVGLGLWWVRAARELRRLSREASELLNS